MTMTIFSTAKPFEGHFGLIQRNALSSWSRLPGVDVILFGDEPGSARVCQELGIRHVPDVATNSSGTPLLSDMFDRAEQMGSDTMCFVNADIILTPDVLAAADRVRGRFDRYLVVARRYDIDIHDELRFEPGWDERIRAFAIENGERKSEIWIDWFIYPKGLYPRLPEFAIGRTGHDNWLIWRAGQLGAEIIDATPAVVLVHQRHDFSHAGGRRAVFEGAESRRQAELIGSWRHYHTIAHARWVLNAQGGIVPATGWQYRIARPKRFLSHVLRFTRPWRRRLLGEAGTVRRDRPAYSENAGS